MCGERKSPWRLPTVLICVAFQWHDSLGRPERCRLPEAALRLWPFAGNFYAMLCYSIEFSMTRVFNGFQTLSVIFTRFCKASQHGLSPDVKACFSRRDRSNCYISHFPTTLRCAASVTGLSATSLPRPHHPAAAWAPWTTRAPLLRVQARITVQTAAVTMQLVANWAVGFPQSGEAGAEPGVVEQVVRRGQAGSTTATQAILLALTTQS